LALLLAAAILAIGCGRPSPPARALPEDVPYATLLAEGETLYSQACAMCHYAGEAGSLAPALRNAPSVQAADPTAMIQAVLQGRTNQSTERPGIMPAQAYLSDFEIAAILTYIRKEFAGSETPVQPADVFRLRTP
jgi:mono/diheme cytochrome c family protein